MNIKGVQFKNVLGASGVEGFFKEGYWFHKMYPSLQKYLKRITFVAKTATRDPNAGNMPLTKEYTPKHLFPKSVKVNMFQGTVLNAVGLSNPGLYALLQTGKWQKQKEPFFLSIASTARTAEEQVADFQHIAETLRAEKDHFSSQFGIQINLSCPNAGSNPKETTLLSEKVLKQFEIVNMPIMLKYSIASIAMETMRRLNDHERCDAVCLSNTLPFGWEGIDWKGVYGSNQSALAHLGGGGLSGKPLCGYVCEQIKRIRDIGFAKHLHGCGGILHQDNVSEYYNAGASSVAIGSVLILRPWRVKSIIKRAESIHWHQHS